MFAIIIYDTLVLFVGQRHNYLKLQSVLEHNKKVMELFMSLTHWRAYAILLNFIVQSWHSGHGTPITGL